MEKLLHIVAFNRTCVYVKAATENKTHTIYNMEGGISSSLKYAMHPLLGISRDVIFVSLPLMTSKH